MGHIVALWKQFPRDLGQIKVTGSIYDTLWRYYKVVGLLGASSGCWHAEMGVKYPPKWEKLQYETDLHPREPIPEGFGTNEGYRIHL